MRARQRTLADWIWTFVGIAGVVSIGLAAYLFLTERRTPREPTPEERVKLADEHWKAGKEKLSRGDAAAAVREIQTALKLVGGRQAEYQNDLGEALLAAGRGEEAEKTWKVLILLSPFFHKPYLNLARRFEEGKRDAAAWWYYRAALALHPEPVPADLPARVARMDLEVREKREREVGELRKDLHANPASLRAFVPLLRDRLLRVRVAEDAAPAEGLRRATLGLGEALGDLKALVARQESAVKDRPDSVVDRAGLGVILLLAGEFARARETFDRALALSGIDPAARLGAAFADLLTGAEGEDRLVMAVRSLRTEEVPWLALGAAMLAHGKAEAARRPLREALALNPGLPEIYRVLALASRAPKHEKDRQAALRAYRKLTGGR